MVVVVNEDVRSELAAIANSYFRATIELATRIKKYVITKCKFSRPLNIEGASSSGAKPATKINH